MKRPTRVRVSPSGRSRARLPLGRVPIRSDKIQRQPNNDEPRPADAGYSSYAQPVTGPAFPARAAMLFRLLSGSAAPRSERCRRSSPETTSRLRLPAGKPTAVPSPLPEPPCIPHLEPPAISIEQFRRMRHFFSIAEESPGLFRTFSGHVLTVVQINVQNRPACPAATQLERKSPPGRWLQAPRSASSPRQGACVHPSTHSTDPHRPMP